MLLVNLRFFRQNFPISPIATGCPFRWMCSSVCVSVTFVRTGRTSAKIKKNVENAVCWFWDLPSNGTTANDLDLNFQGQTFQFAILTGNDWKMQTLLLPSDMEYGVRYLPSNGSTAIVVRHDLELQFQGHTFWNVNISKTVRASEKLTYDFYRSWHLPSVGIIANVVLHDLDQNVQCQMFQVAILTIKCLKLQTLLLS